MTVAAGKEGNLRTLLPVSKNELAEVGPQPFHVLHLPHVQLLAVFRFVAVIIVIATSKSRIVGWCG